MYAIDIFWLLASNPIAAGLRPGAGQWIRSHDIVFIT